MAEMYEQEEAIPVDRRQVMRALALAGSALGLGAREMLAIGNRTHGQIATAAGSGEARWRLFSVDERRTLGALVDTILPATDTPSASQAGVVGFVDLLVAEWFPVEAREHFHAAVAEFRRDVQNRFGSAFDGLGETEKSQICGELEAAALEQRGDRGVRTAPEALHEEAFFDLLKWMTIWGYYTSEVGMREERAFRMVPGRYQPDVPYSGRG